MTNTKGAVQYTQECEDCDGNGYQIEWDSDEQRNVKERCTACEGTGEQFIDDLAEENQEGE